MKRRFAPLLMTFTALVLSTGLWIPAASAANILIHMKTSLAVDDAQICDARQQSRRFHARAVEA